MRQKSGREGGLVDFGAVLLDKSMYLVLSSFINPIGSSVPAWELATVRGRFAPKVDPKQGPAARYRRSAASLVSKEAVKRFSAKLDKTSPGDHDRAG